MKNTILKRAINIAEKNSMKWKIAAIIFKGGKIISTSINQKRYSSKLHPKFKVWIDSLHAEQAAIISARTNLKNTSILVIHLGPKGQLKNAKPCEKCSSYLRFVGIKKVYYSTDNGQIIYSNINDLFK